MTKSGPKTKYQQRPREAAALAKFKAAQRVAAPRLKVALNDHGAKDLVPDHPHYLTGFALLMEALNTTDPYFCDSLLGQIRDATARHGEPYLPAANFMLGVIIGLEPRDQFEVMLAAQIAAVQIATMRSANRLNNQSFSQQIDSSAQGFIKLGRLYLSQMEALKRYRTGGEQKMTVQHVTVSEGGQAIVGNVTQGARDPGAQGPQPAPLLVTRDEPPPIPAIENKTNTSAQVRRSRKTK